LLAVDPGPDLVDLAIHHLEEQAALYAYNAEWLMELEAYLSRVVDYFTRWQHASARHPEPLPRRRSVASIGIPDVHAFNEWLKSMPDRQGSQLSDPSRRHHLRALSDVFGTAITEGKLPVGSNPVAAALFSELYARSRVTEWLSLGELALLLESARTFVCEAQAASGLRRPLPCLYELIATFMLTGAREGEITRLQVHHLDFESRTIDIPNPESGKVDRSIPMHSQLHDILRPYVQRLGRTSGYVFTTASGEEITSCLRMLELIAKRAGFQESQIRVPVFTTSYIIHRLACMDDGMPIDPHKVAREVGYTSPELIKKVFGRVQYGRERMDELAYSPYAIGPHLSARLEALHSPSC
jgi:integrase